MMRTFLKIYCLVFTVHTLIALFPSALLAETRYVSDVIIISVRSGPGTEYKVISTIKTGTAMTVLEEQGDFIKVKTEQGGTGWVSKYYTETKLPKGLVIQQLESELEKTRTELKEQILANKKISALTTDSNSELIAQVQNLSESKDANEKMITELTNELSDLQSKHSRLLEESGHIVEITQERDQLRKDASQMTLQIQNLEAGNKSLKIYRLIYWFLAGAGVLLTGWILGYSARSKRSRSITL